MASHHQAQLIPAALSSSRSHPISYHDLPSLQSIQLPLLIWFSREKREMPWRKFIDLTQESPKERNQRAYQIFLSEIMLQQTKVASVIEYHKRFLTALPTLEALAGASVEEVRELWAGLGYYSRGTRLLLGAQKIMKEFGGSIPSTKKELLTIDGIGPYTASAVASIAFAKDDAVVDGNVNRVISRLAAIHSIPTGKASINLINSLAQELCPSNSNEKLRSKLGNVKGAEELLFNLPGAYNQAIMELGAIVCTPTSPSCGDCPISSSCLAFAEVEHSKLKSKSNFFKTPAAADSKVTVVDIEDLCEVCDELPDDFPSKRTVTMYPMKKVKKADREEESFVWILEWKSKTDKKRKVLISKRPEKGLLAGLYEHPTLDLPTSAASTSTSRTKLSTSFLSTLFTKPISLSTNKLIDLGSIQQVYSGQKRTYFLNHLIITSSEPPELSSKIGKSKWVDSDSLNAKGMDTFSNVGKRIWKIALSGERVDFVPSAKGKARGKEAVTTKKGAARKKIEYSASESESESEVEEKRHVWKGKKREEVEIEEEEVVEEVFVAKKKRRIQLDSDEEE